LIRLAQLVHLDGPPRSVDSASLHHPPGSYKCLEAESPGESINLSGNWGTSFVFAIVPKSPAGYLTYRVRASHSYYGLVGNRYQHPVDPWCAES